MRRFTRTFAVGKALRLLPWRDSFHAKPSIPDKPIFSPDRDSKPAISRTGLSTLIPRGKHRGRKRPDKPITHASRKNKPRIPPRQKEHLDKSSYNFCRAPV